jgi:alpha-tubulin suppressor-like RCC1 family protein
MGLSDYILTIKNDGSVWTWGNNIYGNLGDNSTTNRSSPVLVVGSHSFVEIASGFFIPLPENLMAQFGLGDEMTLVN